jgi:hypothetical protein
MNPGVREPASCPAAGADPAEPRPGLRLRAEDCEDLAVISACLQDALVAVRDLAYNRAGRNFVLVANRFCWEGCGGGPAGDGGGLERTLCGLEFDEIEGVTYRGFRRCEEDRILSLLAIQPAHAAPGGMTIDLKFAAGATIRMAAAAICCRTRDFGEPWPARWLPDHALDKTR